MSMSAPRLTPALLLLVLRASLVLRAGAQHLDDRTDVRQNLCNRTHAVMAGAEMKAALTGAHLTFVAADYGGNAHWYTVDATTGVASGFHVELMGIVAEKAGFTFDIERITSAEFSDRYTWSEYLRLSVGKYDANLDWWLQTSDRNADGVRSPYAFLDMSIVASEYKSEGVFDWDKVSREAPSLSASILDRSLGSFF